VLSRTLVTTESCDAMTSVHVAARKIAHMREAWLFQSGISWSGICTNQALVRRETGKE